MNSISHNIRMIKLVIMRNREAYPHVVTSKQDKNEFIGKKLVLKMKSKRLLTQVRQTGEWEDQKCFGVRVYAVIWSRGLVN